MTLTYRPAARPCLSERRQMADLHTQHGHRRLFLGCSADPKVRSYGFYRNLGWVSTGQPDAHGDEMLEYVFAD